CKQQQGGVNWGNFNNVFLAIPNDSNNKRDRGRYATGDISCISTCSNITMMGSMFKGRPCSTFFKWGSIISMECALQMASSKHHMGSSEAASFQTAPKTCSRKEKQTTRRHKQQLASKRPPKVAAESCKNLVGRIQWERVMGVCEFGGKAGVFSWAAEGENGGFYVVF
ncbi:hypothetical protein ACLOJK_036459, partial [Asimina triloba]